ncbi:MAG: DUF92 domain-containing protein [Candidatus Heimdallarchaeaceae archaeon]
MAINTLTLNILGLVILFIFVFSVLATAEILKRKHLLGGKISRKLIHILVGNVVIVFPFIFSNLWFALVGPLFFVLFTYLTCPGSPIKKIRLKSVEEGHTYGTVFYAISLTLLVILFFEPEHFSQKNVIIFASFLPLVWGDGISAVVGLKYGKKVEFKIFQDKKSLIGSWSLAISSLVVVTIILTFFKINFFVSLYIGLLIAFISAIIEVVSPKGLDNISIPVVNALILYLMFKSLNENYNSLEERISKTIIIIALCLSFVIAVTSILVKALTWDGALAGFFFGIAIFGLGGWSWGAMYFAFFLIGSLTTFFKKKEKREVINEFEKESTARDSLQASVNSIIPVIAALLNILFPSNLFTVITAGALATSLSDTLATEIGSLSKKKPRKAIKPWKEATKGDPGAVSVLGTLASVLGSGIIALIGWVASLFEETSLFHYNTLLLLLLITLSGFIGAYFDSIFAETIQCLNRCVICGKITEKTYHCETKTEHFRGIKFIKNDLVNLLSIAVGSIFTIIFVFLFGLLY